MQRDWEQTFEKMSLRAVDVLKVNWHLGFTAFGGPPVHFKIFHDKFVRKLKWIDEQMYQELFSICQALSGPASTKMLYCINLIHGGFFGALASFFIWSLPGALGMFGLAVGVASIGDTLPRAVYALLSGLNAATVGVIALAAVELSQKAITDPLTRILVFLAASAGMLYNALWYFPVLMAIAGCTAIVHDYRWVHRPVRKVKRAFVSTFKRSDPEPSLRDQETAAPPPESDRDAPKQPSSEVRAGGPAGTESHELQNLGEASNATEAPASEPEERVVAQEYRLDFAWKAGATIIGVFFLSFIVVMVLRGVIRNQPILYNLFANLYLAGTIIFGGGPVVIPLLREYIVAEGWVSPRDFLIGLAIAQSFPGPNFNFAVFLGGLTASNAGQPTAAGSLIAFIGIFTPGIVLVHGTMGVWGVLRSRPWVKAAVRGINAAAVGLIYTAVYRISQVGYLDEGFESGRSLADDPWWIVVTATAFVGGRYFGVAAPVAILLGAVMGMVRYGIVSA
ncbi:chromate transport protein ChrA [Plectosphaerella cucumerina]|uniref:Chromate transport protein ChrA n=1 Tax=Plectosphaerella cucumerina TaxID=40658 RepID=A0A8K0TTP3_9PEZI|nr:chromate transport protein ChrA [Plectosphaerella cucumerina]